MSHKCFPTSQYFGVYIIIIIIILFTFNNLIINFDWQTNSETFLKSVMTDVCN